MQTWFRYVCWVGVVWLGLSAAHVHTQEAQADADAADRDAGGEELIQFNLPENTSLKVLADFVGQKLNLNIVYDNEINGRSITIKAPKAMPVSSLRQLLESMLQINKMVLVETDVPGVLRIKQVGQLNEEAVGPLEEGDPVPEGGATQVISRIFKLEHVTPERVKMVAGPFITASGGATLLELPDYDMVIITDYASNMDRIERLVALADRAGREIAIRFVKIEHLAATDIETQLATMLEARGKVRGQTERYAMVANERTNQLFIVSDPSGLEVITEMIGALDVDLGLTTEVYRLTVVTPEHIDQVARGLIGEDKAKRLYQSVTDEDSGLLAVTTTAGIHKQLVALIETMDEPVPETSSPIRFYDLEHADALAVAETLNGIAGDGGLGTVSIDGLDSGPTGFGPPADPGLDDAGFGDPSGPSGGSLPQARVLADTATNTIIVVAPPGLQPIYETLIKKLDSRRPQVRIEATIVAIDTTDEFTLGVEFSSNSNADGGTLLNFSQFGLSTADDSTGALTLNPGLGFNGALLSADIAEVVIQALQRDVRSRVLTRPSVLVNDNAEGELDSVDTEPFESVNANAQVATTSFAGELEAGTTIKVKPSISDSDFLKLEYAIKVSSFVGERTATSGGGTLPPARTENNIASTVTIPDGHTIVVGGLTREIDSETIQRIPLLGEIPIVEYAFSQRRNTKRQVTLFVFLRAYVMRDDQFEDLKVLSGTAAGRARLPSEFPSSMPVEIR